MEFVTCAVAKLNIEWPREKQETQKKSKLDKLEWGLPFFSILTILHNKLCRSWKRLFSSRMKGYATMPRVEVSPDAASSRKAH